jgi:single-stranded-DNA-specific exonuclease
MLAEHLNNKNDERKGLVASMVKEIKKKIKERYEDTDVEMHRVIVLGNPDWKPSLLGLVASSFSDEHNRPVFLWGREGGDDSPVIKGSCRSGGGIDVHQLMEESKDVFLEYGGHTGAGGFTISQENIHLLEQHLNSAFERLVHDKVISEKYVDAKITLDDVNWNTYAMVEQFAPFGFENPKPLFLFENITITQVKLFGKEKNHLELKFKNSSGKEVTAMAFFTQPEKFAVLVDVGSAIHMVATLEKSNFRNFPELRLRIVDIF